VNVTIIAATPDALEVLLFTKNTRLHMSGVGLEEVKAWPLGKKIQELAYMRNTIQSSWEFVDYIFAIEDVTRAFTHQLVRHRVGVSFAQQAQRVVEFTDGFGYLATGALATNGIRREGNPATDDILAFADTPHQAAYAEAMSDIHGAYTELLENGIKPQDARGILPTNILTNIVMKANLRTLHDMALKRLCVKAQGEAQDVFWKMVDAVVALHPWAEPFLRVQCAWNGTCLFPSLPTDQCHVKPYVYDPVRAQSYGAPQSRLMNTEEIYQIHRSKRTEIQPEAPR
jgi:flavin-dependent thymidylate synthase